MDEDLAVAGGKWCRLLRKSLRVGGAIDKFSGVLETSGLNATELSAYCRERGLFPEQVER